MGTTKIIPIDGGHHVWTRRVGEGPIKVLLLHGGPGSTHEYFEIFEDYLPQEGIEFHFYDQLGSYHSDQPDDSHLWTIERFREEVEEVRQKLGLDNFYIVGSSWGGVLGIEYALKYGEHLAGLVISNMTASIPSYVDYLGELRSQLPLEVIATMEKYEQNNEYDAPEYEAIVHEYLDKKHVCRVDPWPEAVTRALSRTNETIYNYMQGANEFVFTGTLKNWDRWEDLKDLVMPTLLLVGRHDTMSVADIEEMGRRIPHSSVGICEEGSHLSMWDDPAAYFGYLVPFLKEVHAGKFQGENS